MRLVLDVENTVTERGGKLHLDPFEETNTLVMVGLLNVNGDETIVTFDHSEREPTPNGHEIVQKALDDATIIIESGVDIPTEYLFLQVGTEFEKLTGGYFQPNYHEGA